MENSNYSSLTDKLIQNGIISNPNKDMSNFFENAKTPDSSEFNDNPSFSSNNILIPDGIYPDSKKRINEYDMNLLRAGKHSVDLNKVKSNNIYDSFLSRFFPKIYKAKLIKKAMKCMRNSNIDTSSLFNKTIPYGESEIHYRELVKYLVLANELQSKLSQKD